MSNKFLIPFLTAAFLVAPAVLPRTLVSAMAPGLSGAAQAKSIHVNTTKSNTYRTTTYNNSHSNTFRTTTPKTGGDGARMGGGGGGRTK